MLVCVKGFEEISSDELVKINGGSTGLPYGGGPESPPPGPTGGGGGDGEATKKAADTFTNIIEAFGKFFGFFAGNTVSKHLP